VIRLNSPPQTASDQDMRKADIPSCLYRSSPRGSDLNINSSSVPSICSLCKSSLIFWYCVRAADSQVCWYFPTIPFFITVSNKASQSAQRTSMTPLRVALRTTVVIIHNRTDRPVRTVRLYGTANTKRNYRQSFISSALQIGRTSRQRHSALTLPRVVGGLTNSPRIIPLLLLGMVSGERAHHEVHRASAPALSRKQYESRFSARGRSCGLPRQAESRL